MSSQCEVCGVVTKADQTLKADVKWNKKTHTKMLKMALLYCGINEKCYSADGGRGICRLFPSARNSGNLTAQESLSPYVRAPVPNQTHIFDIFLKLFYCIWELHLKQVPNSISNGVLTCFFKWCFYLFLKVF